MEVVSQSLLLSTVDLGGGSPHANILEARARLDGGPHPGDGDVNASLLPDVPYPEGSQAMVFKVFN
jgi:hypothetical protein